MRHVTVLLGASVAPQVQKLPTGYFIRMSTRIAGRAGPLRTSKSCRLMDSQTYDGLAKPDVRDDPPQLWAFPLHLDNPRSIADPSS